MFNRQEISTGHLPPAHFTVLTRRWRWWWIFYHGIPSEGMTTRTTVKNRKMLLCFVTRPARAPPCTPKSRVLASLEKGSSRVCRNVGSISLSLSLGSLFWNGNFAPFFTTLPWSLVRHESLFLQFFSTFELCSSRPWKVPPYMHAFIHIHAVSWLEVISGWSMCENVTD